MADCILWAFFIAFTAHARLNSDKLKPFLSIQDE